MLKQQEKLNLEADYQFEVDKVLHGRDLRVDIACSGARSQSERHAVVL